MTLELKNRYRPLAPWVLPIAFLMVNIVQGIFTPLLNDEPYYWLWAQNQDFGYMGHPPMIAWIIGLGSAISESELGVRIIPIIMGSLTLWLLYLLIDDEKGQHQVNLKLFFLIAGSSMFINLYSFMAIPDTPLLFFTCLFLWQFKRFCVVQNIANSLLLALTISLLLYSKYHGILVIGFVLLANLNLLKKKSFYMVFATALLLYLPHIWWEYQQGFPTLSYHLTERATGFKTKNVLGFVGEQLALSGPGVLLLFSILHKSKNGFQRTLKFVTFGVFFFFLASSFRGMVNAYWTVAAWPGMLVLAYLFMENHTKAKKIALPFLSLSLIMAIGIRLIFLTNLYPIPHFNNRNPKTMVADLNNATNKPLVFVNSFIDPSLYLYYGSNECYAINNGGYKKTQFNYLKQLESNFQGRDVTLITSTALNDNSRMLKVEKGRRYYLTDYDNFRSFQTTAWVNYKFESKQINANSEVEIPVQVISLLNLPDNQSEKSYLIFNLINTQTNENHCFSMHNEKQSEADLAFQFIAPTLTGTYKCFFSIVANSGHPFLNTFNSEISYIEVY